MDQIKSSSFNLMCRLTARGFVPRLILLSRVAEAKGWVERIAPSGWNPITLPRRIASIHLIQAAARRFGRLHRLPVFK